MISNSTIFSVVDQNIFLFIRLNIIYSNFILRRHRSSSTEFRYRNNINNKNTETISINLNTVIGQTRSLRSHKRSLQIENTILDSKNASTSADLILSPPIHSPIDSTTDYTDWDDFDVIDNIATDKSFLPARLSSQVNDYESTDNEIEEDEELIFNFCETGKVPQKFNSSATNTRSEIQGPTDPFLFKKSVLDIWKSIFSPVIDIIVEESNLFTTQKHAVLDTTPEEICAFIGILIFMGYLLLDCIGLQIIIFFCPRVANVMPLIRFLKLLRYIH
ncbi:uncharacterized protein LOC132953705 [Metopolophium dirhodum]|uniref:uncharacterized protein LOC132953705 n=1 Tax=Metopolophium dirhodum TaxID=44670 RepID=UPI0029907CF4|nr:uncharacterized protein LOC132953705 [Metopolophium dirhodum]